MGVETLIRAGAGWYRLGSRCLRLKAGRVGLVLGGGARAGPESEGQEPAQGAAAW
jgi:hypothetical protein